jgi:hypothetical protein
VKKSKVESTESKVKKKKREIENRSEGEAPDTSFGGLLSEPSGRVRGMGNRGIARRKNVSGAEAYHGQIF